MGRSNKKYILILMLAGIFLLTGCDKFSFNIFNASNEEETVTQPLSSSDNENNANKKVATDITADTDIAATDTVTPTPIPILPVANIDLPIYSVNVDTGEVVTKTALIPEGSEITPELIVTNVVEAMADNNILVGIENVTTENDTVIVSFYKDKAPLAEEGSSYETAILNAIAQSLIDNLDDYHKVVYRVEGKAYVSGHLEYGLNEIYFED
ncbi:MAG: hypothetical protein WBI07_14025 [Mobilitalea sp.]